MSNLSSRSTLSVALAAPSGVGTNVWLYPDVCLSGWMCQLWDLSRTGEQ